MAGSHVVVARYDMLALDLLDERLHLRRRPSRPTACNVDRPATPGAGDDGRADRSTPSPNRAPSATPVPNVSIPPWDGKERLNILLIGADQRPKEGTYNTDTLIVVSIDPRDEAGRDVQPAARHGRRAGPARSGPAGVRADLQRRRSTPGSRRSATAPDLFPGTDRTRGYNALKAILGNLYGLDIKYFVEVNFEGFVKVVDALGGVTINVQIPVVDDAYPGEGGRLERLYIPSGIQHMDGAQALRYARSRHTSTDFDRGQRQQRVLLSLREQADPQELIPHLPELVDRAQAGRPHRHPARPARRAARARLGDRHQEHPLVRVRAAALPAGVPVEPARLHHRAERRQDPGGGQERVHDRPGRRGAAPEARRGRRPASGSSTAPATATAGRGWPAISSTTGWPPRRRARRRPVASWRTTKIVVYNGAETRLAGTIAYLEQLLRGDRHVQGRPGHPRGHRGHDRARRRPTSRRRSSP